MIDIPEGKSTPKVLLDLRTRTFLIEGQSYPENSNTFYEPIIKWTENYLKESDAIFDLKIKLLYVNTSSTKALFYLFDLIEDAFNGGKRVSVEWFYDEENEMAKETGEELLEDFKFPFKITEVEAK